MDLQACNRDDFLVVRACRVQRMLATISRDEPAIRINETIDRTHERFASDAEITVCDPKV
jgi:hypothetical protein